MTGNRTAPPRSRRRRRTAGGWIFVLLALGVGFCHGRWTKGNAHVEPEPSIGPESSIERPKENTQDMRLTNADWHRGTLILVNDQTPYLFSDTQDLVRVLDEKSSCYLVRDRSVYLERAAMDALNCMMEDFAAQGGTKTVNVVAGHRTKEFQQHLFDQSAAANGLEHAKRYVAQPGDSEHHTGYALDFSLYFSDGTSADFDGTGEYAWIAENAADYGFVLRYPEDKERITGIAPESWHYRYVGAPHAEVMTENGLCLEEYLEYLRRYPYEQEHLKVTCGGVDYEIYTCSADALYVPGKKAYSLSGNNVDGFIVTVEQK